MARPSRTGFGTKLIQRSFSFDPDAAVALDFPVTGLTCTITLFNFAPISEVFDA